ncbi:3-oxoacyl-ACP synthase [Oceanidesulfovibrio marinus]|uniref:Beta-ketoacyl-[acyl-carrier-protein] synthase III n=2 Tax=Oceanidesulfovibrio marinus TaxID=370038 RepID=A0A6P1ZF25_9BACT|nr:3-oxoacyl-ACP synthase [Oceanidesulfovibrio marinus]
MPMSATSYINGLGRYVPPRAVSNADLEKLVDTSDEWITARTGIKVRHIAEKGQPSSDLAYEASKRALEHAGIEPGELTHVLVATCTPDSYCPNTASMLAHRLGVGTPMAMDINAACTGFLYSLEIARSLLCTYPDAKVLVTASEVLSSRTNWADRSTCVLFGDGAGAAVMTNKPTGELPFSVGPMQLRSDGQYADLLTIKGGGSATPYTLGETVREDFFITMEGREVFKQAVRNMAALCKELLEKAGMDINDVDLLVPHQANLRIIEALGNRLKIDRNKVFSNVQKYGNTSAASIPIALTEGIEQGILAKGDSVLVTSFGAGLTWGAGLLQA